MGEQDPYRKEQRDTAAALANVLRVANGQLRLTSDESALEKVLRKYEEEQGR